MKSIVLGTAGHIDHGKSALVLALTGTDPDRLKEEKARGITIDLGFAHAAIGGHDVAFVDVPGHERFVKNMLAGVGGMDAVLLVIAADEGVMPQTREHLAICRLLQIPAGIVVLTKLDLVDSDGLEVVRLEARELVAGSALSDAPILAVSARTGEGLDALREAIARIADQVPARVRDGASRLPIDRAFTVHGFGTVVTGTLTSGVLEADDELALLPDDTRVKVRGLQVYGSAQVAVGAGRRVAVNLGGVSIETVHRGQTLATIDAFEPTRRFDAVLSLLPDGQTLRHGSRVRFHHGTAEILGRVALASRSDGEIVAELRPGQSAFVRVRLEAPAVLARGDRFIIRSYSPSTTIGGGTVLDPTPSRTSIRTAAATARFRALESDPRKAAMAFIEERGISGVSTARLARRLGMSGAAVRTLASQLSASGEVVALGDLLFDAAHVASARGRLLDAIETHHRTAPMSDGLPREEARERVMRAGAPALFVHLIASLAAEGAIVARERLSLPGRGPTMTPEESDAHVALERLFREAGLAPPAVADAASRARIQPSMADRVCGLLTRQHVLVRIDAMLFHRDSLDQLKQELEQLKARDAGASVDVGTFKARYGISRKFAIPLLEWLDRERVTRRVGNVRVVL
jgi:selenocysteine-specific elongation factor